MFTAMFYGYSAGLLAISGFESSSNFVEQQEPRIPKALLLASRTPDCSIYLDLELEC